MASKGFQGLTQALKALRISNGIAKDPLAQCLAPRLSRSMATETQLPSTDYLTRSVSESVSRLPPSEVITTIYKFPEMEPLRFETYSSKHLHLPLRRDLLHRAVVFEGDATRQGMASTKTRWEVHGSHRKIRPQKGSGKSRLGTKQSGMLRGGAKAFGPRPRDFSTKLPRKMYDLAWRTALSYRYRRGELIVCEDGMDIEHPKTRYVKKIFEHNRWGNEDGRSLVITGSFRKNLFRALRYAGEDGIIQMENDVDVKDLLETGRVIIEKRALDSMLRDHQSDLPQTIQLL